MNKREPDFVDEYYADKNLSQLEKLTLIIPTYNRNYYLSRCLWYHAHFPFHQIIVADSSPEEKKVVNRNTISKIQATFGTDILYLEYNPETEPYGGDIYRKWGDAVQHVDTEYSQLCTDKEFLIPTSINECILYLSENPDYVTAEGVVYKLKENSNAEYMCTPWQDVPSVDSYAVEERLLTGYERVTGALFSIYRSIQHKQIYQNLRTYNVDDIRYGETAIEIEPLFFGKVKKLRDSAGRVRDVSNVTKNNVLYTSTNTSESSFLRYPRIYDYPPEQTERLMQNLTDCLHSIYPLDKETIKQHLIEIIKRRYYPNSGYSVFDKHPLVRNIWGKMPFWIKDFVKERIRWEKEISYSTDELGNEIQIIANIIQNTINCNVDDRTVFAKHNEN